MSVSQSVILEKSRVPDHASLQKSIDALGFDMKVDKSFRPFESDGFLPCQIDGKPAGFEILWEEAGDLLATWPGLKDAIGERDTVITLTTHSDMRELASALILSAALVRNFDGVSFCQDDEILSSHEELMEQAREALGLVASVPAKTSETPLYVSSRLGRNLWQEYRIYPDRLELQFRLGFRTLVVPIREILNVTVSGPVILEVFHANEKLSALLALKMGFSDFNRCVVLRKKSGFRLLRFTPDDPDRFVEVCRSILKEV